MRVALMDQQDGSGHESRAEPGQEDGNQSWTGVEGTSRPAEAGEMGFSEQRMDERIAEPGRSAEPDGRPAAELREGFLTCQDFPALGGGTISPEGLFRMGMGMISDLVACGEDGLDQIRPDRGAFTDEEKEGLGLVGGEEFEQGRGIIAGTVVDS